ncbi:MAG: D-alanyl-D-alanine carboxypeptidase [Ruminococcaceae bacterium]|nr:D-alanyl-D-alanine carboxypeptidase [Oscillospiraceae bacterium]
MKRIFSFLIIICVLCCPSFAEMLPEDYVFESDTAVVSDVTDGGLAPNCRAALLMEASSGKVLYEKNIDEKLPIASVTKVMTLLLVMEAIDNGALSLDDIVTVSENAASMGGSQAYMEPGEQMSVNDMLKAVVVSSANDGAVALGEHIAGSEAAFVAKMNERAVQLGMTGTEFVNATGLDNTQVHYSTARDVAIMSRELIKHPTIFNYTTIWIDTIRDGKFGLSNTNKLIRFYPGANGLKTGSTSKAKFCISATAKKDDMQLIAVILGSPSSDDRFATAKQLFNYGFAGYAVYTPPAEEIEPVRVSAGKSDFCPVGFEGSEQLLVLKGQEKKIQREVSIMPSLCAPVEKGQTVGKITYTLDGEIIAQKDIVTLESVQRVGIGDIFMKLLEKVLM